MCWLFNDICCFWIRFHRNQNHAHDLIARFNRTNNLQQHPRAPLIQVFYNCRLENNGEQLGVMCRARTLFANHIRKTIVNNKPKACFMCCGSPPIHQPHSDGREGSNNIHSSNKGIMLFLECVVK